MKTTSVTIDDLSTSVLAVPPLARHADLSFNRAENTKLIKHIEDGGVQTLMYGGNANLYNVPLSEYAALLDFFAEAAGQQTWVIPSVGPDYGRMMDQADILRTLAFPTCMVLPLAFPATPPGVEAGVRRFAERLGRPVILYLKSETYLRPRDVQTLVDDRLVCGVKYAIARGDPGKDEFLGELLDRIDGKFVISGLGERPAIAHIRNFGLVSFTSGSVCVAPRAATLLLAALKAGDDSWAEELRAAFLPLEDCRDAISPIRVLHDAVTLAGIADMGPILPLLHNLEDRDRAEVARAACELRAFDRGLTEDISLSSVSTGT